MIVNVVVASIVRFILKIMRLHVNVVRIDGGMMLFRIVRKDLLTLVLA
jgi:small neutral amino acid transporter SnatA (MarC family)